MSFCSGNEYNLPIDQNLYKLDFLINPFPLYQMVFLSTHLLVTCTEHFTTEIKQTCFFFPTPSVRDYANILKECTVWR